MPSHPVEVSREDGKIDENGPPYRSRRLVEFLTDFFRTGSCIQVGTRGVNLTRGVNQSKQMGRGYAQNSFANNQPFARRCCSAADESPRSKCSSRLGCGWRWKWSRRTLLLLRLPRPPRLYHRRPVPIASILPPPSQPTTTHRQNTPAP